MRQRAMQFSDARVARSGEMRKDVAFPLRNTKTVHEDANAVRGAMNFGNQAKGLSRHEVRVKLCVLQRFPARASTFRIGQFPTSWQYRSYPAAARIED